MTDKRRAVIHASWLNLIGGIFMALFFSACAHSDGLRKPATQEAAALKAIPKIIVIGHRGAAGYRPEHTLASYDLAIEMGADFIEPDLVMTRDGVLIARHENEISGTTDAAEKFPARKRTKTIDGSEITGWFSEDFLLSEIKTLRAKERLASRDQSFNGQFEVLTFAEILEHVQKRSLEKGRVIGVYVETKHPSYFTSIQLPLEPTLAYELKKIGWTGAKDPVVIQSFELGSLRKLREFVGCRMTFLYDDPKVRPYDNIIAKDPHTYGDYTKPEELKKLSSLLYGIGPWKRMILPEDGQGHLLSPTHLVEDAHRAGLVVHPYTFRGDAPFLAAEYNGNPLTEYRQFFKLGVDGVFSDFADQAVQARSTL